VRPLASHLRCRSTCTNYHLDMRRTTRRSGSITTALVDPKYSTIATPGIYAVYLADRRASGKVRCLCGFLAKQFEASPYWDRNPFGR
jgi:hypothetical protein